MSPGVAHFAPSVAPLAQISETRSSSSPHCTVSVRVTIRKADPESPFGPGGPAGPAVRARRVGLQALPGPARRPRPVDPVGGPIALAGRAGRLGRARPRGPVDRRVLVRLAGRSARPDRRDPPSPLHQAGQAGSLHPESASIVRIAEALNSFRIG